MLTRLREVCHRKWSQTAGCDTIAGMPNESRGADYLKNVESKLEAIEASQASAIQRAGAMIADAYQQDRLIYVYGGGGDTVMMVCEMFLRSGGMANV